MAIRGARPRGPAGGKPECEDPHGQRGPTGKAAKVRGAALQPQFSHRRCPSNLTLPALFRDKNTFVVPVTSGQYAPERITFASANIGAPSPHLLGVTALLVSGPAGCVVELWLLADESDPTLDASYIYSGKSITTGAETWALASYPGAQIRVRSGGTAGNAVVSASAD